MDRNQFDALTRVLASTPSRRGALGALLGAGLAGIAGSSEAARRNRKGKKGRRVSAQAADCLSPGPGTNLNRCNFNQANFVRADLSGSSMAGTRFRGANLCGADLSSSQLRDADFRGLPTGMVQPTNLTLADLSSSGCRGIRFDEYTILCQTKTCNGAISNRDCPDGIAVCCGDSDCPVNGVCDRGRCETVCPPGRVALSTGGCAYSCETFADCAAVSPSCAACVATDRGVSVCVSSFTSGSCTSNPDSCEFGQVCSGGTCVTICDPK